MDGSHCATWCITVWPLTSTAQRSSSNDWSGLGTPLGTPIWFTQVVFAGPLPVGPWGTGISQLSVPEGK
jgi:hypothetical protein